MCFSFLYKPRDIVLDYHIKNTVYLTFKLLYSFAMAYIKNRKHVGEVFGYTHCTRVLLFMHNWTTG
jgi:hypothetical protein